MNETDRAELAHRMGRMAAQDRIGKWAVTRLASVVALSVGGDADEFVEAVERGFEMFEADVRAFLEAAS